MSAYENRKQIKTRKKVKIDSTLGRQSSIQKKYMNKKERLVLVLVNNSSNDKYDNLITLLRVGFPFPFEMVTGNEIILRDTTTIFYKQFKDIHTKKNKTYYEILKKIKNKFELDSNDQERILTFNKKKKKKRRGRNHKNRKIRKSTLKNSLY